MSTFFQSASKRWPSKTVTSNKLTRVFMYCWFKFDVWVVVVENFEECVQIFSRTGPYYEDITKYLEELIGFGGI